MQRLTLALPGNEDLARGIAQACGSEAGRIETRRFPDGESYVRLHGEPADRIVDVICTLAHPDPQFLLLVAPFLAYMRQDKRIHDGESVTSRSFARLVSSTFDKLLTVDPHLHRYPTLSAVYTIPTITLHAAPLLADWIANHVEEPLIVGPDEESEQWAGAIASRIGVPHAVLRKTRHGDRSVDIDVPDLSIWRGRTPVLVDDIASSGRTLAVAARKLAEQGMRKPECVVVHALFAEDAWAQLTPLFARITSTDAVPHPSNRIGLASLIADALSSGKTDPRG